MTAAIPNVPLLHFAQSHEQYKVDCHVCEYIQKNSIYCWYPESIWLEIHQNVNKLALYVLDNIQDFHKRGFTSGLLQFPPEGMVIDQAGTYVVAKLFNDRGVTFHSINFCHWRVLDHAFKADLLDKCGLDLTLSPGGSKSCRIRAYASWNSNNFLTSHIKQDPLPDSKNLAWNSNEF